MVDIVLSGEPDDLQAAPEWSFGVIGSVDRFIEEAKLTLGAKSYPLTPAEEMCLTFATKSVKDYVDNVRSQWSKMLKRIDAKREANSNATPAKTSEPPSTSSEPVTEPMPFGGGTMAYFEDRVEFCGTVICMGSRGEMRRRILNVLKSQSGERFKAFSGEELAQAAEVRGGAKSIPGAIRELRDDIVESLRSLNITAGSFRRNL